MKKNLSLATITVLIAGCTILKQPTETDLWALSKAEKYSKAAQISYLKCSYQWPDTECLQNNWDTYGSPEIGKTSQEKVDIIRLFPNGIFCIQEEFGLKDCLDKSLN